MNWLQRLLRRREMEASLDKELRFHFEAQVADYTRAGLPEVEARRQARIHFGGVEQTKEECRDARGTRLVESTLQDVRYGLRTLRRSPIFTLAALTTLTLGIGANAAIFQLLEAVRLRNLPVPRPHELAQIRIKGGNLGYGISDGEYRLTAQLMQELSRSQTAFSDVFGWTEESFRYGDRTAIRTVPAIVATATFFDAAGVRPAAGRFFDPAEDGRNCTDPAVILSHAFWKSEFGGDHAVIGRRIPLDGARREIIGVAPAGFHGLEVGRRFDVALPVCVKTSRPDSFWLNVFGRLKPGWNSARATEQLQSLSPALFAATLPNGYSARSSEQYKAFRLESVAAPGGVSDLRERYNGALSLLFGITGMVLLLTSANLANLMLARASARRREFGVRLALGASRLRLARQTLAESLLLASAGAILGTLLAQTLSARLLAFIAEGDESIQLDLSPDWLTLAFIAAVSLGACAAFGLVPALRSTRSHPASMKVDGRGLTAGRDRLALQRFLIVAQVAVSMVLVTGALLFMQSFRNLLTLDPGFQRTGIWQVSLGFPGIATDRAALLETKRHLLEELRAVPGVEGAASTTNLLVDGGSWSHGITLGATTESSKFTWVSEDYFRTIGTRLLAGRDFTARDTASSPRVAIVNQAFVRRFLGGGDPLGKTFRTGAEPHYPATEYQIVGVVKDTRYHDLREQPPIQSFAPAAQCPVGGPYMNAYLRTHLRGQALQNSVRSRLGGAHPGMSLEFHEFERVIEQGLARDRMLASLSGFFGFLAAALASVGLYGLMAYSVARRRNEIGIRIALGASRADVLAIVMREAGLLCAAGLAIGLASALAVSQAAASLLFGLSARDPLTFGLSAAVICGAAALGSYLPARAAARLDPTAALRTE